MKKLFMLMIIIFSIFVVSDVKALKPNAINIAFINGLTQTDSNPSYTELTNQGWYTSNVPAGLGNSSRGASKWAYQYNLSGYTKDWVTFLVYGNFYNLTATINGKTCQVDAFTSGQVGYQYAGITCDNPKGTYWLNINTTWPIPEGATTTMCNYMYILQDVEEWDDKVVASLHTQTQIMQQQTQQQQQQHQDIINDDTSGNASDFSSDISNFSVPNDSHALDILGTLQNFVGNIQVSGSCRRISVPIPFTDKTFTLPCMTTDVYSVHFREIVVIWQIICRGVGYYYILVNVLKLVKETLDPFNFKLEVLDL